MMKIVMMMEKEAFSHGMNQKLEMPQPVKSRWVSLGFVLVSVHRQKIWVGYDLDEKYCVQPLS